MNLLRAFAFTFSALPFAGLAADRTSERPGFTIGVSNRWLEFDYTSDTELEKTVPTAAGTMIRNLGSTPLLRLDTPLDAQGRFVVEAGFAPFDLPRQLVRDREQTRDLGTRLRGYYAHVTPTAIAVFPRSPPWEFSLGLGAGIGYLRAYGDMIFTEDGSNALQRVDIGRIGVSVSAFFQVEYGRWQSRIQFSGPVLNRDGGSYTMTVNTFDLGHRFTF